MALGKTTRKNDLKAFALKLKLKDGEKFLDKPVFEVSQRQGDKYVVLPEKQYEVTGNLIGVEPREYIYQEETIRSFTLSIQDNDEIYFVSIPFNSLGRGLANSVLALPAFDNVQIGLYATKPKEKGGKSFPAASLRQNDEIIRWKFNLADIPAPTVVKFKGKDLKNYTDQEVFFSEKLREFNKVIKAKAPVAVSSNTEAAPATPEDKEDVPF